MTESHLPQPVQALLDVSKIKRITIQLSKKDNDFIPSLSSKIGGIGYLPVGAHYPVRHDGVPLVLLAQLNFRQIADAVDIGALSHPLPNQGILQIYIDGYDNNYAYGCDFSNYLPHDGYQVRFYQDDHLPLNYDELHKIRARLRSFGNTYLPFSFDCQYDMRFLLGEQSVNVYAYEFAAFTKNLSKSEEYDAWHYFKDVLGLADPDEHLDSYDELAGSSQHQIFGYPNFTQTDPREYNEHLQQHILLLQIESDDDNDIMWGDAGVANFFIHPNELKNQDFGRLIYNWDCC